MNQDLKLPKSSFWKQQHSCMNYLLTMQQHVNVKMRMEWSILKLIKYHLENTRCTFKYIFFSYICFHYFCYRSCYGQLFKAFDRKIKEKRRGIYKYCSIQNDWKNAFWICGMNCFAMLPCLWCCFLVITWIIPISWWQMWCIYNRLIKIFIKNY